MFYEVKHGSQTYTVFMARVGALIAPSFQKDCCSTRVRLDLDDELLDSSIKHPRSIVTRVPTLAATSPLYRQEFIVTRWSAESRYAALSVYELNTLLEETPMMERGIDEVWPTGFVTRSALDDTSLSLLLEKYALTRIRGNMKICKAVAAGIGLDEKQPASAGKRVQVVLDNVADKNIRLALITHCLHGVGLTNLQIGVGHLDHLLPRQGLDKDAVTSLKILLRRRPFAVAVEKGADCRRHFRIVHRLMHFPLLGYGLIDSLAERSKRKPCHVRPSVLPTEEEVAAALEMYQRFWTKAHVRGTMSVNETVHSVNISIAAQKKALAVLLREKLVESQTGILYATSVSGSQTVVYSPDLLEAPKKVTSAYAQTHVSVILFSTVILAEDICDRLATTCTVQATRLSSGQFTETVRTAMKPSKEVTVFVPHVPVLEILTELCGTDIGDGQPIVLNPSSTTIHDRVYAPREWILWEADSIKFCAVAQLFQSGKLPHKVTVYHREPLDSYDSNNLFLSTLYRRLAPAYVCDSSSSSSSLSSSSSSASCASFSAAEQDKEKKSVTATIKAH